MGKIIDKNGNTIKQDDQYSYGTVVDFLEENNISCMEWDCLSDLVKTMTGDACTLFNTIGEMIKEIPDILSCSEECAFLYTSDNKTRWFILDWDYEGNTEQNNKILHTYFPEYEVIED